MLAIVVAYGSNRAIGYRGELPWRLPSDLRRFRELTVGATVVMGRRTYESLPSKHRPLRERHNVVLSANPDFTAAQTDTVPGTVGPRIDASAGPHGRCERGASRALPGLEVHTSLDSALAAHGRDCFVIGGASIYAQALPLAERVYATHVEASPQGDAFFPELPPGEWRCVEDGEPIVENGHRLVFRTFQRARPAPMAAPLAHEGTTLP
jgi:dihydrofolate reductase